MFRYNLTLALASLQQRPGLTFLVILTIAIGLSLYTTVQTMAYHSSSVPVAHKSMNLFSVQMDNRELAAELITEQMRMVNSTYKDAMNLRQWQLDGVTSSINWNSNGVINVEDNRVPAIRSEILATDSQFFTMFETPFLFGSGWSPSEDRNSAAVIVLSRAMNDRLFGGENSVGKILRINTLNLKVVGVMADWTITRRFYDRSFMPGYLHEFFVPFQFALDNDLPRNANFNCWSTEAQQAGQFRTQNLQQLLSSECTWVSLWAEIPDRSVEAYRAQVGNYIAAQKELGRFPREPQYYVTDLQHQVNYHGSRNGYINTLKMISLLFFAVCLLNAVSILLAKFIRRSREVSLRRALGARKSTIIYQYVLEVSLLGAMGGMLGILLSKVGLWGMLNIRLYAVDYTVTAESIAHQYQLNWLLIGEAFFTSIVCALVVSMYPIWRVCNISPATQLKAE
ncbi:ABC transporter permease [Planctobacterium marinum]|uniref:ABC transporter ATP-binding protein n=1 Tax=Planctobacterium marinum TaxID=1631968 RepID=A0AA48HVS2_9ALTE|nr:ABC transporter ATP-binding protein [Planctobacterium marinum]